MRLPIKFGDKAMNKWASPQNPQRFGTFVEIIKRTGRMNAGTRYRLTDRKGKFWELSEDCLILEGELHYGDEFEWKADGSYGPVTRRLCL